MKQDKLNKTWVITLIRECYGRFNSYRTGKIGMQLITEIHQFVNIGRKTGTVSSY